MFEARLAIVYSGERNAALLLDALPQPTFHARTKAQLLEQAVRPQAAAIFIDVDLLYVLEGANLAIPVVAVTDGSPTEALALAVKTIDRHATLAHVITAKMLSLPTASPHLMLLMERLMFGPAYGMLADGGVGRRALIASSQRREARFERMSSFLAEHGVSSRSVTALYEAAEELVMNSLYDAPFEAGFFPTAISRAEDVELPARLACEISYGVEGDHAFVRVRDPFGSLSRARLLDVLNRCNAPEVRLDESRGGAGLGLWRVFTSATMVSITVLPGKLTDILVTTSVKSPRAKQLAALHLFFAQTPRPVIATAEDLSELSITLVLAG